MLNYERMIVGELRTNCYIVWNDDKSAVIIDPGDEGVEIAQEINRLHLKPLMILLTHGHFDHMLGVLDLKLIFKIPVAMDKEDIFLTNRAKDTAFYFSKTKSKMPVVKTIDSDVGNIKTIKIGDEILKILKTPGHTPGGVCFYNQKNKMLFSGDTLFAEGNIGSSDHLYSSTPNLKKSLKKLFRLPSETLILPGHGESCLLSETKKFIRLT